MDEAARFAELGREASPADDWASQISWRSALTQVLARRGDLGEAERLARECVALTEGVDYLNQMGEAWDRTPHDRDWFIAFVREPQ